MSNTKQKRIQCNGKTSSGKRCTRSSIDSNSFCRQHLPKNTTTIENPVVAIVHNNENYETKLIENDFRFEQQDRVEQKFSVEQSDLDKQLDSIEQLDLVKQDQVEEKVVARQFVFENSNWGRFEWLLGGPKKIDNVKILNSIEQVSKFIDHPHIYCNGISLSRMKDFARKFGRSQLYCNITKGFFVHNKQSNKIQELIFSLVDRKVQCSMGNEFDLNENISVEESLGRNESICVECSK